MPQARPFVPAEMRTLFPSPAGAEAAPCLLPALSPAQALVKVPPFPPPERTAMPMAASLVYKIVSEHEWIAAEAEGRFIG